MKKRFNSKISKFSCLVVLIACIALAFSGCAPSSNTAVEGDGGNIITADPTPTENSKPFGDIPAGIYTYVAETPSVEAGSGEGQFQYVADLKENNMRWAIDIDGTVKEGTETITEDALYFLHSLYYSDRPVTDWLQGSPRDTVGYAGAVAGNLKVEFSDSGKLSKIDTTAYAGTRVTVHLSKDITENVLTVTGVMQRLEGSDGTITFTQSCTTLTGSCNGLYLTSQGDVILDRLTIGNDGNGTGLLSDKIGGDTFIVGIVNVDGEFHWNNLKANIQALSSEPGTILTDGQDIIIAGCVAVGHGRELSFSTGEGGGDIIIGQTILTDSTRGGMLPDADTSSDGITVNISGNILAGTGDVLIGTNTEKGLSLDLIGDIQGNNITIKPIYYGEVPNMKGAIGNITATGNVDIEIGTVNVDSIGSTKNDRYDYEEFIRNNGGQVIGNISSEKGNITLTSGFINGTVGDISAPEGTITLNIDGLKDVGNISGAEVIENIGDKKIDDFMYMFTAEAVPSTFTVTVDGVETEFNAYTIDGENYFKIRDIAYAFGNTDKKFYISWDGAIDSAMTITTGRDYEAAGEEMGAKGTETVTATPTVIFSYVDTVTVDFSAYVINEGVFFSIDQLAEILGFSAEFNESADILSISTAE